MAPPPGKEHAGDLNEKAPRRGVRPTRCTGAPCARSVGEDGSGFLGNSSKRAFAARGGGRRAPTRTGPVHEAPQLRGHPGAPAIAGRGARTMEGDHRRGGAGAGPGNPADAATGHLLTRRQASAGWPPSQERPCGPPRGGGGIEADVAQHVVPEAPKRDGSPRAVHALSRGDEGGSDAQNAACSAAPVGGALPRRERPFPEVPGTCLR